MRLLIGLLFGGFLFPAPAQSAATSWQTNPHGQVRLISPYDVAPSSGPVFFGLHFKMIPGWHVYYKDPGDAGYPPKITWEGSKGFAHPELLYPKPSRYHLPGNLLAIGYEKEVVYPIRARRTSGSIHAAARLSYLTCGEICVPYQYTLTLDIPSGGVPQADPETSALIETFVERVGLGPEEAGAAAPLPPAAPRADRWGILLLAFIGGILLNVMPCVLPVLSIKLLGLLQHGGQSRYVIARDALASVAGVLASFMALGAAAAAAKSAGRVVGWGIQFQEPVFIAFLIIILTLFALNLWGLFEIHPPRPISHWGAANPEDQGLLSYFTGGLFTTLLATPCSAPFLGTAVGFALTQSAGVILLIFLFVGLGLAFPYILLALFPSALRWLPKPGAWMLRLKGIFGFFLAATVVWLAFVLSHQVSALGLGIFAMAVVAISMIVWWREMRSERDQFRAVQRGIFWLLMALLAGGALRAVHNHRQAGADAPEAGPGSSRWRAFDEKELDRLVSSGEWVFVDVTADWCITCKVNEKTVLNSPAVLRAMEGVVRMRADWTQRDPAIGRYLMKFGRAGIPFYALYRPGRPPVLLSEFLTQRQALDALER